MEAGYLRFWNGLQWTDDRALLGSLREQEEARLQRAREEYQRLQKLREDPADVMLLEEVGIHRWSHPLHDAATYKAALETLEAEYKALIKSGGAVTSTKKWIINGSEKDGAKMVADLSKLMLRAYNNEVDNLIRTLKPHALDKAIANLDKLRVLIARLGASMKLGITDAYHAMRVRELKLTADYVAKVAEQKEREREERERLREEAIARRDFEAEQARLEKERSHYLNVVQALAAKGDSDGAAAAERRVEEIQGAIDGVVQRAANIRAGYVYVISNVGAFGERVVKIGLTRRLQPMDRVLELGDASVPFRFDVHALIFSDDAVTLENQLHREFEKLRVNLVNARREFFYVTPTAVKEVLLRLRGDLLTFVEDPLAPEWFQSERLRGAPPLEGGETSAAPWEPVFNEDLEEI